MKFKMFSASTPDGIVKDVNDWLACVTAISIRHTETKFTVLFVTHSISEAIRIGTRILVLSAHPGQVKAELKSDACDEAALQELLFDA